MEINRDEADKIDADPVKPKIGIMIDLFKLWRLIKRKLKEKKC